MKKDLYNLIQEIEEGIEEFKDIAIDYTIYINHKYYDFITSAINFKNFECKKSYVLKDNEAVIFLKKDFIKFKYKWEGRLK